MTQADPDAFVRSHGIDAYKALVNAPFPPTRSNLDRPAPNAAEAECALLGHVFLQNTLIDEAATLLPTPSYFSVQSHQWIYGAMLWLGEHNQPIDPVVIGHMLRLDGHPADVNAMSNMAHGLPGTSSIKHYAALIKRAWVLRSVMEQAEYFYELAADGQDDPDTVLALAEEKFASMRERSANGNHKGGILRELQPEAETYLTAIESGNNPALPTGISTLDNVLNGGLMPGGLYGLAARTGEGKSLMMKQWLQHMARRGVHGILFSLEMTTLQNTLRWLSSGSGVPLHHLKWGANKNDTGRVRDVMVDVMGLPIHVYGDCRTIPDIWSRVKELKRRYPIGWMVIDHFHLVSGRGKGRDRYENRTGELEHIANLAKEMAMVEQLPLAMPAQFDKVGQKAEHPQFVDVRGGVAFFDACDVAMVLETSEYKNAMPHRDAVLRVQKNRQGLSGEAGILDLVLDNQRLEFHPVNRNAVEQEKRKDYL